MRLGLLLEFVEPDHNRSPQLHVLSLIPKKFPIKFYLFWKLISKILISADYEVFFNCIVITNQMFWMLVFLEHSGGCVSLCKLDEGHVLKLLWSHFILLHCGQGFNILSISVLNFY